MSDAATPAVQPGGTPPAAPAATPAAVAETVTLPKEEADQLRRDAARASVNQSKADRFDRIVGNGKNHFGTPPAPVPPPSKEERAETAAEEDRKAERGLLEIAADPAFREVLDADPTLRALLTKNPLAVLPMLAPGALDADDAIELVKENLGKRKPAAPAPVIPPTVVPAAPAPAAPPAGGINTVPTGTDAEYEAARGLKNTESAIAGMVASKAAKLAGAKK